jgi:uroporphyrinogen-III synthase
MVGMKSEFRSELKPLAERKVVVTRSAEQAVELTKELEALGAEVLLLPLVEFAEAEDAGPLDSALRELESFDWLVLTSGNAARFVALRMSALGLKAPDGAGEKPRVAAVGMKTARAAREAGLDVRYIATRQTGAGLAEELRDSVKGARVLLPRSDRAAEDVPVALRGAGADVVEVVAYRTMVAELNEDAQNVLEKVKGGEVDVVSFMSGSAFAIFRERLGADELKQIAGKTALAAIGPTTSAAKRKAGVDPRMEAGEQSAAGLALQIGEYFREKRPEGATR